MKKMSPEEFWDSFAKRLRNKLGDSQGWREKYESSPAWTRFMMEFLEELGSALGFTDEGEISREYYRIDLGYYKVSEPHIWDFEVAIEHENSPSKWLEEFMKLIHINCGLKVIITYHDYGNRRTSLKEKLDEVKELYSDRRYRQGDDNWLFIFGPRAISRDRDFVAYKFYRESFEELSIHRIMRRD